MNNKKIVGGISPLLLLCTSLIWGFAFVAQSASSALGAFTICAIRHCLGAIFLILIIPLLDKITGNGRRLWRKAADGTPPFTKRELIGGAYIGAALALAGALQQLGMNNGTDPGKSAFISALYVVVVPIFSLAVKKKSPFNVWVGVLVATIGFYVLCVDKSFNVELCDLLVFFSACGFALHIMIIGHFSPSCDGVRLSAVQFTVAGAVNCILALIFDSPISFVKIAESFLPLLYLGIMSGGVAYTLQIIGQKHTKPAAASLILSLESVFGAVFSALAFGKFLSLREYIGGGIVFLAVIISQLNFKPINIKK